MKTNDFLRFPSVTALGSILHKLGYEDMALFPQGGDA